MTTPTLDPRRERSGNCGGDTYRGWSIYYDPPPIPIRDFDWHATSPNYDASYEGEEDGWVDNGEKAEARTREALLIEIDNWFEGRRAKPKTNRGINT